VPRDYSWVFHASEVHNDERELIGERITLSGQALLDAFQRHKPQLLADVIAIDGVNVGKEESA